MFTVSSSNVSTDIHISNSMKSLFKAFIDSPFFLTIVKRSVSEGGGWGSEAHSNVLEGEYHLDL